jgi:hypothetical protein
LEAIVIAEELHIIKALQDDDESNAVCSGLAFKYGQKSNVLKIWGPSALEGTKTNQKDLGPDKIKLGAYYIAHSAETDSSLLDPKNIVIRLEHVLEDGLKRLEKLVLVTKCLFMSPHYVHTRRG